MIFKKKEKVDDKNVLFNNEHVSIRKTGKNYDKINIELKDKSLGYVIESSACKKFGNYFFFITDNNTFMVSLPQGGVEAISQIKFSNKDDLPYLIVEKEKGKFLYSEKSLIGQLDTNSDLVDVGGKTMFKDGNNNVSENYFVDGLGRIRAGKLVDGFYETHPINDQSKTIYYDYAGRMSYNKTESGHLLAQFMARKIKLSDIPSKHFLDPAFNNAILSIVNGFYQEAVAKVRGTKSETQESLDKLKATFDKITQTVVQKQQQAQNDTVDSIVQGFEDLL